MKAALPVYMIGHSKHPWPKFVELLALHKIKRVIDVRTNPQSRFCPQFNKKAMQANLGLVLYDHINELGGKNPLPVDLLRMHVAKLLPPPLRICMMCSEGNFLDCHRHYLLSPLVIELGYEVLQIQPDGSLVKDTGPTPATLHKMAAFLPAAPGAPSQTELFEDRRAHV